MQSFAFVIFGLMLFMNSAFAADSLISSHTTHPVLEALPSASPQASFQIARTYYLPDYQQQINNVKGDSFTDRGNEDNTNRNDTCSSGGYYSFPLGSGYNCSRVVYAHQACYSCTAKPCPSGYTAGLTKCADKTGYSASYSSNGYTFTQTCKSGTTIYGTCKANTCSGVTSVAQCGSSGASGWTWTANGCKSAGNNYGTYSAKACASGYTAGLTSCSTNYTISYNGYSGNSKCGKCTYSCSVNDSGRFYNEAACGIFSGYDLFPLPFIESCGYKLYLCKQWNYPQGGDFTQSVCNEACGNLRYSSGSGFPAEQKDHDENLCRAMCNYIFRCDSYIGWCPPDVQNQSPPMML